MGYVPLFDNLTTGTLHGRWPDIGLWPVMLSMADRFGRIDVTPQYIAGVTGLDVQEVVECIGRFCSPDEDSRSKTDEDEGRRLEPLEPGRKWGWKVVNHAKYREKARLLARDSDRTASGLDAERKRKKRECPPLSPEIPPSDGDGDGDSNNPPSVGVRARTRATPRKRCPDDWHPPEIAIAQIRSECPDIDVVAATRKFRDHEFARGRSDWLATWRNWMREEQSRSTKTHKPRRTRYEEIMQRMDQERANPTPITNPLLLGLKP